MRTNDFSMQDLYEFGILYYKILGVKAFRKTFVEPLGNEIITEIAHKITIESPITNKKHMLTNRTRISFLSRMFSFNSNSFKILNEQIPPINYSNPIIRFIEMEKKEIPIREDIELIELCVEYYLKIYGHIEFMKQIKLFIFEIFKVGANRFSELFESYTRKTNYISIEGKEIESIKHKIIAEFSTANKEMNSPFILIISKLNFFNYEQIELDCNYLIFQTKTYFTNEEKNPVFTITHDEYYFIQEIRKLTTNGYPIKIEFLHKNPKKRTNPDLIKEIKQKVANSNQKPIKKAA